MIVNRMHLLLSLSLISLSLSAAYAEEGAKAGAPVAKIGNTILTEDNLRKEAGVGLYEAENQVYQMKKSWVDQKAKAIIFAQTAKEAGLTLQAWVAREIDGKMTQPTLRDVDQLAPRFGVQGSTLAPSDTEYARMKDQARQYLAGQSRARQEDTVYQQLVQKYPVEILFTKPQEPHIEVTYAPDDPMRGPKSAPVTIVEFTDFQCPYCKSSQNTLKQVESAYADKVNIVERQYPLPFHNRAKPAAEAALCAKDQGKFWEMHDKLFPSESMEDADIQRFAKDIGLNEKKFNKCLTDHKYMARIEADIAEGQRFGVRGTPHFFINGRTINGAQPFEAFKTVIDEELAKKKG